MAEDTDKLYIEWRLDQSNPEKLIYILACTDPDYPELRAQVGADEVTERAARARLISMIFTLAREQGVDTSRLRFHV